MHLACRFYERNINKYMDPISYKTKYLTPKDIKREWLVVDVAGKPLGRVATQIATLLMGKHKPSYTPHMLSGDYVIVINAEKVELTGKKWDQKTYVRYTGYPGGERMIKARDLREKHPERLIQLAVKRMLPKNKLGHRMMRNLKVYAGAEHPHEAQNPRKIELDI